MLQAIKDHVSKDRLILLSYGMTATVLAYDLAKLGYWAVDLGHLDLEYEWYLHGAEENKLYQVSLLMRCRGEIKLLYVPTLRI